MPRRQRFKPSRKPKPAIDPSDEMIIPTEGKPTIDPANHDMNAGQRGGEGTADVDEDRVSR